MKRKKKIDEIWKGNYEDKNKKIKVMREKKKKGLVRINEKKKELQ